MKYFFLVSLGILFLNLKSSSQCNYPAWPKTGKSVQSFIPKGWELKDSTIGDFNEDGIGDAVLVLNSKIENNDNGSGHDCSRPLLILQGTNTGFTLSAFTNKGILCKGCGGVFGDPYESITLKKNVLNINHYAGSSTRWSKNATFRFQQKQWTLIGISESSYWSLGECSGGPLESGYNLSEANFNTAKAHLVRTEQQECKPHKDVWVPFRKKPLIILQQYDIDRNYFPVKEK